MRDLLKRLNPLEQKQCLIAGVNVNGAVWTRPELRAKVAYRGWASAAS
jgi:hypothetical protein